MPSTRIASAVRPEVAPACRERSNLSGTAFTGDWHSVVGSHGPKRWSVEPGRDHADLLHLAPLDDGGTLIRWQFLQLDGPGVRDLHFTGEDLHILVGPTTSLTCCAAMDGVRRFGAGRPRSSPFPNLVSQKCCFFLRLVEPTLDGVQTSSTLAMKDLFRSEHFGFQRLRQALQHLRRLLAMDRRTEALALIPIRIEQPQSLHPRPRRTWRD